MRLIDADKLLNENCGYILWGEYKSCAECYEDHKHKCYHEIDVQDIMDAPTIEADPIKHGQWIVCDDLYKTIDGRVFDGYRECSVCGEMYPYFPEHNYCPNCGADMREVEE